MTTPTRQQSFSSLPPIIFHKYGIEKQLENGAFGEVLKAYRVKQDDKGTKESVTIRTFRESHKSMDELDMSEIEMISSLDHENVVKIFDTVWHINSGAGVEMYVVYEFCNRGDLREFVTTSGKLTELQIQDFTKQMATGMGVLRRHLIVNRDLKPSHILVEQKANKRIVYKIADMGLTKLFFDDQEGIALRDCAPFVAPEVMKSSSTAPFFSVLEDSKIDLWSLGVLMLYCLNGEPPFNGSDVSQYTNDKDIDVTTQIPKGSNEELVDLIRGLVRLDPAERMSFEAFERHPFIKSLIWFARPYAHVFPCNTMVTSLCCDDSYILCGLENGLIEIFDRKTFRRCQRLDFHRKTVSALAVNKEIIISGSQDTTIAVWSKENFERMQILYHHRNTIIGIEIIGSSAYSACLDGTHKAFSIDYKKLYARKNGFNQRRYSIQDYSNEEFREELEFQDDRTGKTYTAHWRDHDHMHSVAGIIVIIVYVAEDNEFRPFHILSSRAFNSLKPQLQIRLRDDGNEHFVRKLNFDSHVRQVQKQGKQLIFLHWDGRMTLFSVEEVLSQRPNDELSKRTLVEPSKHDLPTWFCVQKDSVAFYTNNEVHLMEYQL